MKKKFLKSLSEKKKGNCWSDHIWKRMKENQLELLFNIILVFKKQLLPPANNFNPLVPKAHKN